MKISNYIKIGCAAAVALAASQIVNAMTEDEKQYIKLYGMVVAEQSGMKQLEFNKEEFEVFAQGMREAFEGKELPANVREVAPKMSEYLSGRAEASAKKLMEKQAKETEEFWSKIKADEKILKAESGLAYEMIAAGEGPMPTVDSTVKVKYTGKFIDGKVFDTSEGEEGGTRDFPLTGVIKGFTEGLQKVAKGGKIRLYIPADLGYGAAPQGPIPGGSTLIFDVEMVDFSKTPAAEESHEGHDHAHEPHNH